jgi:hypothetical protein
MNEKYIKNNVNITIINLIIRKRWELFLGALYMDESYD